jgi:signal transduction histidine kinase
LGRVFGQLLDNAMAACPRGGRILVEVARLRQSQHLRVVVSDDGPGMDAATLARAMDGLRLGPDGTVERRQGLGLPLARQLVEAHGGTLELLSEPGQGTAVIVELP